MSRKFVVPVSTPELDTPKIDFDPPGMGDIAVGVSLNMQGNYVYGVHAPTNVDHALTKGYLDGLAFKLPCRVATTALISLSGLQTIDGVAVAVGDRVLVKNQGQGSPANGIYIASNTAWTRAPDNNTALLMAAAATTVNEGTWTGRTFQNKFKSTDTLGTTGIDWWYLMDNLAGSLAYASRPTGTPDGTKFFRDDNTWALPAPGGTIASITMRRTTTAGQLIPDSVVTPVDIGTVQDDIGGITYSNPNFTVPQDGTYYMACNFSFSGIALSGSSVRRAAIIQVNGSTVAQDDRHVSANAQIGPSVSTTKRLAAGDTVRFCVYFNAGGSSLNLGTSGVNNWGSVTRVDGVKGDVGPTGPSGSTAAHASNHASGGSDPVALAASQITSGTLAAARLPGGGANGTYMSFASTSLGNMATSTFVTIGAWTADGTLGTTGSFISGIPAGAVTFSVAGVYQIIATGSILSGGPTNPGRRIIAIFKGATEMLRFDTAAGANSGGNPWTGQISIVMRMSVNETFTVQMWQNSGSAITMAGTPGHELQIIRLSD